MKQFIHWGLRLSIILYTISHFLTYFHPSKTGNIFLVIWGICLLFFTLLKTPIHQIKMPFGLVIAGLVIILVTDTSLMDGVYNGMLQMRNMIALLVVVPMISWVLHEEDYIESFLGIAHKLLDTSRKFYFGIISFTQIIAYFLLFGSITMMYQFASYILKDEKGEVWENYKGTALIRGFSLSVMWVVSIPSFAYAIEVINAPLGISIFQGLLISIGGVVIALLFSYLDEKRYGVSLTTGLQTEIDEVLHQHTNYSKMTRNVIEFVVLFITLFGSIFVLQAFLTIELLVLIPLVVLVWILSFYVVKGRAKKLWKEVHFFVQKGVDKQAYQLCVMLGAGTLIFALNQTAFASVVVNGIYQLQEHIPFLNVLYFLPFIIIILGFIGLGPLTVMVLVGGILQSIQLPYPPELIVLAISSGSAISILLSPLIMPLIALSSVNGLNPVKNGLQFNWKYGLTLYIMVQVYIQVRIFIL
ncbi:hypothetical protein [Gracilibacillus sp. YIM 98692]|uniref:hypothetical protein n=1 Tax=Gracilibacillus sp. YIM 98692 TaxID=2663532 RepID=UPI0013D07A78|nr:hypothetical protein [Gracilibacillus sp. YIM 98692]